MPTATLAPGAGPAARAHLKALGLGDASRYATIRGFPVLDAHPGIKKKVKDRLAATPENPEGVVEQTLAVTPDDLATLAENSNRLVAAGRPPRLQIGHTPLEDRPEPWQPKPVGLTSNYAVRVLDGRPWLCCDLHYRADRLDEASDYPNISVERANWRRPDQHEIHAVALIRRRPERDVPLVPYEADCPADSLVCYGRDLPAPGGAKAARAGLVELATRLGITVPSEARRRAGQERANYAKDIGDQGASRPDDGRSEAAADAIGYDRRAFTDFCTRRNIADPREGRTRWAAEAAKNAQGKA